MAVGAVIIAGKNHLSENTRSSTTTNPQPLCPLKHLIPQHSPGKPPICRNKARDTMIPGRPTSRKHPFLTIMENYFSIWHVLFVFANVIKLVSKRIRT